MAVLHRVLALGMRGCEVSLSDVTLTVSQQDAPGPYTALGGPLEGRDALRLYVRQLLLLPEAPAGPWHPCRQRADSHAERQDCKGYAGNAGRGPAVGEQAQRSCAGALDAARTPAQLLASAMTAAPAAVRVQVTGLSLSLLAYDARRPAQQQASADAAPAAAAAAAAPGPSSSAAGFTAGVALADSRVSAGAPPSSQPFRQRKRFRASGGAQLGSSSEARPSAPSGPLAAAAALHGIPVEQHVLLQQWGFEVTVRVPARRGQPQEQLSRGESPLRHHRIHTNPVYASEEASTPSTSDTGAASVPSWQCKCGDHPPEHQGTCSWARLPSSQ